MKRLLSWLLALVMIISCLPMSAIPAFAAEEAPEVEGTSTTDPDFTVTLWDLQAGGSEENPLDLTNDLLYENDFSATVTIPANEVGYFIAYRVGGMNMTINDGEAVACTTDGMMYPYSWTITNDTDAAVEYTIKVAYPVGSYSNPVVIEDMSYYSDTVTQAAGAADGYYYIYTAQGDGSISIAFDSVPTVTTTDDDGNEVTTAYNCNISVTNQTTGTQMNTSDATDGVVTMDVTAGDVIMISVAAIQDAEGNYNPAAEMSWYGTFTYTPGSEQNPIWVNENITVTIPAGETYYFASNAVGSTLNVTGEGNVTHGETTGASIVLTGNATNMYTGMSYATFTIANTTEADVVYTLELIAPLGSMDRPAELVIGENSAAISAGSQGYYYTWTATEAGTLSITMPTDIGWAYVINNMTSYAYGDTQWSDSDPVVNPGTIEVAAGDVIEIMVNTYDPANPWSAPAGTLTITAAFTPAGPIVDESLKFQTKALTFQEDIGVQLILLNSVVSGYDSFSVECVHNDPVDGVSTETLEYTKMGTYAYRFNKNMLSWSMVDELTITIYAQKDGVTYIGESFTTSIESLAYDVIEKNTDTKTRTVLVDMLNYGAEVQKAFNHNADDLANADLGEYASYATAETPTTSAVNTMEGTGSVTVVNHAISMSSQVQLQTIFRGDISAYELRYTVDGVTTVIPSSSFDVLGAVTRTIVAVKAANMRKTYTIALYDPATNEPVSTVYSTSVEGFASAQLGGTYNDVFIAMMKYGDAVAAL